MVSESYLAIPVSALLSFLYLFGKELYQFLKNNEGKIKQKINSDIYRSISRYKKHYKKLKKEIGIEKFANRLLKFSLLGRMLEEGKYSFERDMKLSIIFVLISGVLYSVLQSVFVSTPPPFLLAGIYGAFFWAYICLYIISSDCGFTKSV